MTKGSANKSDLPDNWRVVHYAEAEFLGEIPTKDFSVFLLVIHSHLYSFALRFLFLQSHATPYSFCKGARRKTWWKTIPSSLWFEKSVQKPQVWELSRLCPETSMKLYIHDFVFCRLWGRFVHTGEIIAWFFTRLFDLIFYVSLLAQVKGLIRQRADLYSLVFRLNFNNVLV